MNKSETIGCIADALSKFQGETTDAIKDTQGYGYKYSKISQVFEIARPLLLKNNLAVTQLPFSIYDKEGGLARDVIGVETMLMHSSGEWIKSTIIMAVEPSKSMNRAQATGSVITYAKRYGLMSMLGIADSDDDGRQEHANHDTGEVKQLSVSKKYKELTDAIVKYNITEETRLKWCEHFNVNDVSELSDNDIFKILTGLTYRLKAGKEEANDAT